MDRLKPTRRDMVRNMVVLGTSLTLAACGVDYITRGTNYIRSLQPATPILDTDPAQQTKDAYTLLEELSTMQGMRVFQYEIGSGRSLGKKIQVIFNNPHTEINMNGGIIAALDGAIYDTILLPDESEINAFLTASTSVIMWDVSGKDGFGGINPLNPAIGVREKTSAYKTPVSRASVVTVPYDGLDPYSTNRLVSFAVGYAQAQTNGYLFMNSPRSVEERARYKEEVCNGFGNAVRAAHNNMSHMQYVTLMSSLRYTDTPEDAIANIDFFRPLIMEETRYSNMKDLFAHQPLFTVGS